MSAAGLVLAVALLAGMAQAQLGDPGETTGVDTDYTPRAKESVRWHWYAGAKFGQEGPRPGDVPEGSRTPFELDFFDVDFRQKEEFGETDVGLAAGAECPERLAADASAQRAREQLAVCERVPVIYRYSVNDIGEEVWEEVYRGEGPGYVGAVAWIDRERAVAVGGNGMYPRRELRRAEGESDAAYLARSDAGLEEHAAGMGRAWVYEHGAWRELSGAELPTGMRGMTALDFSPRKADCGEDTKSECGFAGGLRQLWRYRDGRFDKGYIGGRPGDSPPPSEAADLDRPELLRFRVRDIEFVPIGPPGQPTQTTVRAVAATSGCCDADPLKNVPWALLYDEGRWRLRHLESEAADVFYGESQRELGTGRPLESTYGTADSWYESGGRRPAQSWLDFVFGFTGQPSPNPLAPHCESLAPVFAPADERPLCPLAEEHPLGEQTDPIDDESDDLSTALSKRYQSSNREADETVAPYGLPRRQVPDSYYDLHASWYGQLTLAATPGGPAPDPDSAASGTATEPASQIVGSSADTGRSRAPQPLSAIPAVERAKLLTTLRLHAVEAGGTPGLEAVGVLLSSGQGAAYGLREKSPARIELEQPGKSSTDSFVRCDSSTTGPQNCEVEPQRGLEAQGSLQLFKLPAYALNSLALTDEDRNVGWAVGDHGAILKLGAETAAGAAAREPAAPQLRGREAGALPDSSAYDAFRPFGAGEPGLVPALAGRAAERLPEPQFVSGGLPHTPESEEVAQIVMSRDGLQGWAFGKGGASYYDGASWRRCDTEGIAGLVAPDPVCDGLVGVVRTAARVPLENDDDPANDDEFELIAAGERRMTRSGVVGPVVLRYANARWSVDEGAMRAIGGAISGSMIFEIAFTSPSDGWAVAGTSSFGSDEVLNFDGERWVKCAVATKSECDDLGGRLLLRGAINVERTLRLATVGDRTYLYGTRLWSKSPISIGGGGQQLFPMIVYHDRAKPCETVGDEGCWRGSGDGFDGGYDPSFGQDPPPPDQQGRVFSLSLGEGAGGAAEGWALGQFGSSDSRSAEAALMRLVDGRWRRWTADDASADYLRDISVPTDLNGGLDQHKLLASLDVPGRWSAFLFATGRPSLGFNRESERWEALPTPFWPKPYEMLPPRARGRGAVRAVAPDGRGGFWAAVRQLAVCSGSCGNDLYFYNYTDRPPSPVFDDAAHPVRDREITAAAAGGDGSFWLGTASNALYRYDRVIGWDRVVVPGWDPPRSTVSSPVTAVAVAPDGRGIAVGAGGRIAEIGPRGARLDPAAGRLCDAGGPVAPCGTGRTLSAAAVAPDGAALTAANAGTLLWRPAGGEFRLIEGPRISPGTEVAGVSLPQADRAYLATAGGELLAGQHAAGAGWSWRLESLSESRAPLSLNAQGRPSRLNAIAVDTSGHGYAVGERGLVLERSHDGRWQRLATRFLDNFHSLALPPGGGSGALIGGENGLVLTLVNGRFQVAHQSDPLDPVNGAVTATASVLGVALVPGSAVGQLEAWAVQRAPGAFRSSEPLQALLHYSSDPEDPLLAPDRGVEPLPDTPAARPGELAFAAFGKQECRFVSASQLCPEAAGARLAHDVIARAVNEQIASRAGEAGGPAFALFTGDANDAAGGMPTKTGLHDTHLPGDRNVKHRRWLELIANPLSEELPLFGAIGGQDLSHGAVCDRSSCVGTSKVGATAYVGASVGSGANVQWRETMGNAPAPWEAAGGREFGGLRFERVEDARLSVRVQEASVPEVSVKDLGGTERAKVKSQPVGGGASTHYAVDVTDAGGEKVARLVFVDTSLGSLAAGDGVQQPLEPDGGQAGWLEKMLCFKGAANGTHRCDRERGQQAIVVSNTPTYTYAQIPPTETQADASAFEAILLRNQANVVVSGRLGWNGRYWATAPGVHEPCPDSAYQPDEAAPEPGARACGRSASDLPVDAQGEAGQAITQLASALGGLDAPQLPAQAEQVRDAAGVASGLGGVLPFVVSSAAGGRFNQRTASTDPEDGFWSGYSVVRLDASGDPKKTIVEQRPVLDWVSIRAQERTLRPGQRMTLKGFGREPIGIDQPIRYIEIDSPAITHRYDLLLADPDQPWVPETDGDGEYVPLDPAVATIDQQTGVLKAGRGRQARTYAIGVLSVGDKAATYPLVFEPAKSFKPKPALSATIRPPALQPPALQAPPQIHVLSQPPAQPPATPPPPAQLPTIADLQLPAPPQIPTVAATPTAAPTPAPPPPPTPPPPPGSAAGLPLNLNAPISAISIVPTVIPPTPPPINPAPPGGSAARKEAKQRQAATAKSEEGASEGASEGVEGLGGDPVDGRFAPKGAEMTRRERTRPQPSISALGRPDQASAWSRTALYGGSAGVTALALALAFSALRPTPRRRTPHLPAPATARIHTRRRQR